MSAKDLTATALTYAALSFMTMFPAQSQGVGDRIAQSRAVEAVIWGMPAVNYDLMRRIFVRDIPSLLPLRRLVQRSS